MLNSSWLLRYIRRIYQPISDRISRCNMLRICGLHKIISDEHLAHHTEHIDLPFVGSRRFQRLDLSWKNMENSIVQKFESPAQIFIELFAYSSESFTTSSRHNSESPSLITSAKVPNGYYSFQIPVTDPNLDSRFVKC